MNQVTVASDCAEDLHNQQGIGVSESVTDQFECQEVGLGEGIECSSSSTTTVAMPDERALVNINDFNWAAL